MSADHLPDRSLEEVRSAVEQLRARLSAVSRPFEHPIDVMAVTKGFAPDAVRMAVDAGCRTIGENYAQELLTRRDVLEELGERRPEVWFIGHLQSNKVRQLAGVVDVWATVDRASLAREIARRDPGARVLLQVNVTGEAQKSGCPPDDVADLIARCRELGLAVEGVLAMGPTDAPPEAARPGFELARRLVDEHELAVCSIGMSADLEVAAAAGSTQVRVGTALFGPRPPR